MRAATSDDTPTEVRLHLQQCGFDPLPCTGKIPDLPGWQNAVGVHEGEVRRWGSAYRRASNTGIITRNVPSFDIDISREDAAIAVEEMVRKRFDDRDGIMPLRFGRPPRRLIPFRTDHPFTKMVVEFKGTKSLTDPTKNEKVEILCDGQQFIACGTHPDTRLPYRWHGKDLGSFVRDDLVSVTGAEMAALLNDVRDMLVRDFGFKLVDDETEAPASDAQASHGKHEGNPDKLLTPKRLAAAMRVIPNDCDWDGWARVGLAIFAASEGADSGFEQFDKWSQKSSKYDPQTTFNKWNAFHRSPPRADGIGGATLVHLANAANPNWDFFWTQEEPSPSAPPPEPDPTPRCTLDDLHGVCSRWLGEEYDLDVIDAVVATAASEGLQGDPLWLLVISGPGNTKTETVQTLSGCGAYITSTIQSEGALLSASSRKDRSKAATGGLLRKMGDRGILVIKDVTSILSSDRNVRASVLAAIREIYDGKWERNVGTDGGQTLTWTGRIAVVGAVTTAWDAAHAVVAAMGDRFVLIRSDSRKGRKASGSRAIRNTGSEKRMREELAAAVAGVVQHASQEEIPLTEGEITQVLNAADITTLARTAVERDYAGEVIDAHAPEMPTRFAKQLTQMVRGGVAVGMSRERAMQLAVRCARDSIPPLRLEILLDVARHPDCRPGDVRKRLDKPWRTVKREMEALNMLGLLSCDEEIRPRYEGGKDETVWRYSLAESVDRETLLAMAGPPRRPDWADFG